MSTHSRSGRPKVVFLCRSNTGKSRMAGALAVDLDGDGWVVTTAGTHPASPEAEANAEAVASLAEQSIELAPDPPRGLDPTELAGATRVVLLGSPTEEQWQALGEAGMAQGDVEVWEIVEPSHDGIEGAERMRLILEDIAGRVRELHTEMIAP